MGTAAPGAVFSFCAAEPGDVEALLALQEVYYREDGYPFEREAARRAFDALIAHAEWGRLWVVRDARAQPPAVSGYCALAFGFSLEYRGRDAFLDELYLAPAARGHGLGRAAVALVEAACRDAGVRALHLEVERDNAPARALYRRRGFAEHERLLMTRRLDEDGGAL